LSDLLIMLDTERHHGNLSSAIQVFVLEYYRDQPPPIDPTAMTAVSKCTCYIARYIHAVTATDTKTIEPVSRLHFD
jgi:hypothetical protein